MIERIEALIAKATQVAPTPWLWDGEGIHDKTGRVFLSAVPLKDGPFEVSEFVYHARQLLPLMLEVVNWAQEYRVSDPCDEPCGAASCRITQALQALDAYCADLPEEEK